MSFILSRVAGGWNRYEGPTWIVASAVYVGWFVLVAFAAQLQWWIVLPAGAYLVAWQASLQHETIHAMTRVPNRLKTALVSLPIGIFVPYSVYVRDHRRHHAASNIADEGDPESDFHGETEWNAYPPGLRALYLFNQTLLGRFLAGPPLQLSRLARDEWLRVRAGDLALARTWLLHAFGVALLLAAVEAFAHLTWWRYLLLFGWPGYSLGMLRSFAEHRWTPHAPERTAIIESRFPLALLFLNNNLHLVHHLRPSLPWYDIPRAWRAQSEALLEVNGRFFFRGYGEIARRWALRPITVPVRGSKQD